MSLRTLRDLHDALLVHDLHSSLGGAGRRCGGPDSGRRGLRRALRHPRALVLGIRSAQKIPSGIRSVDDRTWWLEVSTGVGLAIGTVGVVGIVTGPALRARAVEF